MRLVAKSEGGAPVAPSVAHAGNTLLPLAGKRASRPNEGLLDLCLPLGPEEEISGEFDRLFLHPRHLPRKEVLYRAGDAFAALHVVRAGTFKTVMLSEDGREQITGYHMAGDIVGLDGLGQPLHNCDAIALEESDVCSLPLTRLNELARDPRLMAGLFQLMARDVRRSQDLIMLLGGMCAEERIATFLLNLSHRRRVRGLSPDDLALCMTREEIASFIGLKLETVSRILSRFQGEGHIRVQGRAVTLLDHAGLRRIATPSG
jgi:CRP/FNR family transcriptional regulator